MFLLIVILWIYNKITWPHTAAKTVETISQFGGNTSHSDAALSDFYLFGFLKGFLCGTTFSSDNESKKTMTKNSVLRFLYLFFDGKNMF